MFHSVAEMLQEIQKLHKTFMSDEKRVRNSNKAVEDSMDTRRETKRKLSMCSSRGDLATLEKKVKELNMRQLNQKVNNIQLRDGWDFSDIKVQSAELPEHANSALHATQANVRDWVKFKTSLEKIIIQTLCLKQSIKNYFGFCKANVGLMMKISP